MKTISYAEAKGLIESAVGVYSPDLHLIAHKVSLYDEDLNGYIAFEDDHGNIWEYDVIPGPIQVDLDNMIIVISDDKNNRDTLIIRLLSPINLEERI